jgi:hypothetical protein
MMFAVFVMVLLAVANVHGFGMACSRGNDHNGVIRSGSQYMPNNLKIAFIGDNNYEVLQLVLDEGAEAIVHAGDFDYEDDADLFFEQIEDVLPDDFPYFVSIGNHDVDAWSDYHDLLMDRYDASGVADECIGTVGIDHLCSYKGLLILSSGVGTCSYSETSHIDFVDESFSTYGSMWKVCNWHKNQEVYQLCTKSDETGYGILDACRQHGAIVDTAHEHSYARTFEMSNFQNRVVSGGFNPVLRNGNANTATSFLFCSGLGGESIRDNCDNLENQAHWAATAAGNECTGYCRQNGQASRDVGDGALFCTFKYGGIANLAQCYFKDTTGYVFDLFNVTTQVPDTPTAPADLSCTMPFLEFTSTESRDNRIINKVVADAVAIDDQVIITVDNNHDAMITINNIKLESTDRIVNSRLQVYSAVSGRGLPKIVIRGSHNGELTNAAVQWIWEGEDWERHTVWNTDDLATIVTEIIQKNDWKRNDSITFIITLTGESDQSRSFYTINHGSWFAPTLTVQLESPCN